MCMFLYFAYCSAKVIQGITHAGRTREITFHMYVSQIQNKLLLEYSPPHFEWLACVGIIKTKAWILD